MYQKTNKRKKYLWTKYLLVPLDGNLPWKKHLKYIENKIKDNFGIMFKAKLIVYKKSFQLLLFFCINSKGNYTKMGE